MNLSHDNRKLNMSAVLAPNTLSHPQIVRMVLKSKNGHRPKSACRLIS